MVGNYIVSFIGFMPADNPQIVLYVAVDNPKGITQYGGTVSAPLARSILIDAIEAFDIEQSKDGYDKEYQWYDTKYYKVPDVVGLTLKEANNLLKKFKIEYTGDGNIVKEQSPKKDSYIKENGVVKILLG